MHDKLRWINDFTLYLWVDFAVMAGLPDRRRVNGPSGGTAPPVYTSKPSTVGPQQSRRTRPPREVRKICMCRSDTGANWSELFANFFSLTVLRIGLTPSASGSAYLELEPSSKPNAETKDRTSTASGLKLTCTVHGPRPVPRSAPFSSNLLLSTRVKFAPFAARQRRGYIPDPGERDLAAHLESALRGVLIGERWPKSGVDVIITVLEGEEDNQSGTGGWGMMSILSGCITVACAALVDAGIDCVDLVTGGVSAIVSQPGSVPQLVLDPCPSEHEVVKSACVIAYLQSRDEITEIWTKGDAEGTTNGKEGSDLGFEVLVDKAVEAASAARRVLVEAVKESTEAKLQMS